MTILFPSLDDVPTMSMRLQPFPTVCDQLREVPVPVALAVLSMMMVEAMSRGTIERGVRSGWVAANIALVPWLPNVPKSVIAARPARSILKRAPR